MTGDILQFRQPAYHDPDEIYSADLLGVISGSTEGEDDRPLRLYVAEQTRDGRIAFIFTDPSTTEQVTACATLTGEQARQLARAILGQVAP